MGSIARGAPGWNTGCCDRTPHLIDVGRYVCPLCGQVWLDTAHQVRQVFGPGVERVRAQRDFRPPVIFDGWIDERIFET